MPLAELFSRSLGDGDRDRKYLLDRKVCEILFHQYADDLAARCAQIWIGGAREQDDDRVAASCRDMCGAGVVAYGKCRCPSESGESCDIGVADKIQRLGADLADRAAKIGLAVDAHQDRQVPYAFQTSCQLAIMARRPAFGQVAR